MSFKIGNVVQLTSKKGPLMTVRNVPHIDTVDCFWFDGAYLCKGTFPAASLTIIEE